MYASRLSTRASKATRRHLEAMARRYIGWSMTCVGTRKTHVCTHITLVLMEKTTVLPLMEKNHIVEFTKIHSPLFEKLVLLHIIKDLVTQTRLLAHLGSVIWIRSTSGCAYEELSRLVQLRLENLPYLGSIY